MYKFTTTKNGKTTTFYLDEDDILLFYRLKQAHEIRKFGFSVGSFEDFLQNFEKEESESELFWKKILYCSLFAVLALILSPVILSTSWWYLPQQISYSKPVVFILSLVKGVLVTIAFLQQVENPDVSGYHFFNCNQIF